MASYLSAPPAGVMSPRVLRVAVAGALAAAGLVHLLLASTYGQGSAIVGVAFVVGGLSAFAAATWLLVREADAAWDFAAAVSGGMLVALALSATTGLFGIRTSTIGLTQGVSIASESFVVIAWLFTRLRRR